MTSKEKSPKYYDIPVAEVLEYFEVDRDTGLAGKEVERRRERYGPNRLAKESRRGRLRILIDQFKSIVIIILVAAALFAFITARYPEAIALVAVTLVNTAIGFFTELKAIRSMEALRKLGEHRTRVLRAGKMHEVAAEEVVPGDIIELSDGELVPADIRLIATEGLRVNEAALTGESASVNKGTEQVDSGSRLHERTSMLYKGTTIAEGTTRGVVTTTAMETELGRIAKLTAGAEEKATPLQKRLDGLGRRLAWITLGVAVLVGAAGLAAGRETVLMIETAIALGVAAIPEGLPIVATIALARGMWLMAKRNALVNRLTAVEALGATTVIFTDKTGTLTENRMRLVRGVTAANSYSLPGKQKSPEGKSFDTDSEDLQRLLRIGALCTNAKAEEENNNDFTGDPTEVALLKAAQKYGLIRKELLKDMPEEREVSFDSETMKMATVHRQSQDEEKYYVAVKGAPLAVLEKCDRIWEDDHCSEMNEEQRTSWQEQADEAVLTRHHWQRIGLWSVIVCLDVLLALTVALYGFGFDQERAVTISFLTLAFAKLWFVVNLRDRNTPAWKNDVVANPWIWAAWTICILLLLAAVYWTPLSTLMQTASPQPSGWLLVIGLSLVPAILGIVLPGIHFYSAKRNDGK